MGFGRILLTIKVLLILETFFRIKHTYMSKVGEKSYTFSPVIYLWNLIAFFHPHFLWLYLHQCSHLPNNLLPCAGCQSLWTYFPIWWPWVPSPMELFFYLQLRTFPKAQTSAISTSTYIALKKKKNPIWMVTVNFQWLPFLMFQPFSLFPAARSVFRHFPLQLLSPQWNFNTTDMLHIYLCTVCYKGALN